MRGRAFALLFLLACDKQEKPEATPAPSSSSAAPVASAAEDAGGDASIPMSSWSTKSNNELELAGTPGRTAMLVFSHDYAVRRGDTLTPLPREWFGAGPPRHDLSLTTDGDLLAVPVNPPPADEAVAVVLYSTRARRFVGRFAIATKDIPDAGAGAIGKVSGDGKSIVWTLPGRPCMATDVVSGKPAKCK